MRAELCPNCGHTYYKDPLGFRGKDLPNILTLFATGTFQTGGPYDHWATRSIRELNKKSQDAGGLGLYSQDAHPNALFSIDTSSLVSAVGSENLRITDIGSRYDKSDCKNHYCATLALAPEVSVIGLLPVLFEYAKNIDRFTFACPVCGTTLKEEDTKPENILCQEKSHAIIDEIKRGTPIPVNNSPVGTVDLRAFLKHLLRIEANLYSLEQVLAQAISKQRDLQRKERMAAVGLPMIEEARQTHVRSEITQKISEAETALQAIPAQMPFVSENVTSVTIAIPVPRMPELQKPWFFNRAKVEAENAALLHAYEEGKAKYDSAYQRALLREQERRKAQNKQIAEQRSAEEAKLRELIDSLRKQLDEDSSSEFVNPYTELHNWSKKEVQDIKDKIQELCVARAKLLAMGIVHPKYADIVALSTMLEYLETGRCTQLKGQEGAYNLYESEIRANRIIAQLDQVIDSLEEIKRMQYYTYQVLTAIQSNTQAISAKMDSAITTLNKISEDTGAIRETTEVIAYNTEKTAYYAKMNAELTDALGFMLACK